MIRALRWLPVWIVAVAVFFGAGLWVGSPRRADSPVLLRAVQELSDLGTVKYAMSHVMTKEKVTWLGTDQVLLVAQGVVKAGIDLRRMPIAAHEGDIHKEAGARARDMVEKLFRQLGFDKVEIDFDKSQPQERR